MLRRRRAPETDRRRRRARFRGSATNASEPPHEGTCRATRLVWSRDAGHSSGTYIPFLGPVAPPCRTSPSDYLIQRVNRTLNGLLSAAQPRIRRVDLCAEILEEERP